MLLLLQLYRARARKNEKNCRVHHATHEIVRLRKVHFEIIIFQELLFTSAKFKMEKNKNWDWIYYIYETMIFIDSIT